MVGQDYYATDCVISGRYYYYFLTIFTVRNVPAESQTRLSSLCTCQPYDPSLIVRMPRTHNCSQIKAEICPVWMAWCVVMGDAPLKTMVFSGDSPRRQSPPLRASSPNT